jgi:LytS/YehU family sensor histidine kinase
MPIPFKAELDHVRIYTDLEKLRFKEKVNVIYDIRADQFKLPSMTVQMMVENAIKHGITQREEGGTVTVTSEELEDAFRITVADDGVGCDANTPRDTSRSHIGLDNLEARLKNVVNGTFEITSTPGKGTVAVVTIPKKAKKSRS